MAILLAQSVNQDVCSVCQITVVTLQLQLLPPKLVLSFSLMERNMVGSSWHPQIMAEYDIVVLCYSEGEYVETSPGKIERNGMGTHQSANGMVYTGQWVGDKMNGKGLL